MKAAKDRLVRELGEEVGLCNDDLWSVRRIQVRSPVCCIGPVTCGGSDGMSTRSKTSPGTVTLIESVPQSMLAPSSILQLDYAVSANDAIAQPPLPPSQASDPGTTPSHIHPAIPDADHCQHTHDLAAVLRTSEARLADHLFSIENILAQRMSSAESRVADIKKLNVGPPSPCSAMTQCQGFFPSPPTFDRTTIRLESLTQHQTPAAKSLEHLPAPDCTEYDSLVAGLESRYGDSHLGHLHLTELQYVRQGKYTLQEHAAHVERWSWKAAASCPNSTAGFIATHTFKDAISDLYIQRFVRLACPYTVHTVLALALETHILDTTLHCSALALFPVPKGQQAKSSIAPEIVNVRPHRRKTSPRAAEGQDTAKVVKPLSCYKGVFQICLLC
ncbi:hypothetical protein HPB50_001295 [Hyalomma asiaticum]|uniref:Uncharacterized protein n=1 Tax=Hyalomma asiaticum TaxID=266040 RepID=A0ACB7RNL6_HYAAI|nr:hypothetical protein HPB50_001295 [Hyalomma asiaticum]